MAMTPPDVPIVHLVSWRLSGDSPACRQAQAARIVTAFRAMAHDIEGLMRLEVGANVIEADDAWDLALVLLFRSRAHLLAYQHHPAHLAVKRLVAPLRTQRAQVDFEWPAPCENRPQPLEQELP